LNVRNPLLVRQAQWRFSRPLPRASASGARDLKPGVKARCSSARVGVGRSRGGAWRSSLRRESAWARREARRDLNPCDVRNSPRRASAGEGAEAHDLQPGEVFGACRRGRRRFGVVAMCSSARIGVDEGAVACKSTAQRRGDVFLSACRRGLRRGSPQLFQLRAAWGATGQLSGIWLGLWGQAVRPHPPQLLRGLTCTSKTRVVWLPINGEYRAELGLKRGTRNPLRFFCFGTKWGFNLPAKNMDLSHKAPSPPVLMPFK